MIEVAEIELYPAPTQKATAVKPRMNAIRNPEREYPNAMPVKAWCGVYEILKGKLGEKEAKTLVEYIEAKVDKRLDDKKDLLATKEDINNLKIEIEKIRTEMEKTRSDIIKWMFLFWIGQLASLAAILKIFFGKWG